MSIYALSCPYPLRLNEVNEGDKRDNLRDMFQWACGGDWSDGMGPEPHGVRVDPSPAQLPSPLRHRYRHRSCQRRRGPPRSRWRPPAINNKKRRSHAFTGLTPSTRYILFSRARANINASFPSRVMKRNETPPWPHGKNPNGQR